MLKNSSTSKVSYFNLLKDPRWQKKRLQIFNRDKFKCRLCGDDTNELQVHHKEYKYGKNPWEYPNESLITLCKFCHSFFSKDERLDDIKVLKIDGLNGSSMMRVIYHPDHPTIIIIGEPTYGHYTLMSVPDELKLRKFLRNKFI